MMVLPSSVRKWKQALPAAWSCTHICAMSAGAVVGAVPAPIPKALAAEAPKLVVPMPTLPLRIVAPVPLGVRVTF